MDLRGWIKGWIRQDLVQHEKVYFSVKGLSANLRVICIIEAL